MRIARTLIAVAGLSLCSTAGFAQPGAGAAKRQPQMAAALTDLRSAQDHLQGATADKAGHREKALAAIKSAITEVQTAMAAANSR